MVVLVLELDYLMPLPSFLESHCFMKHVSLGRNEQDPIEMLWEFEPKILQALGVKRGKALKFLGRGANGIVYALGKNKTLKVTCDPEEILRSSKLIGRNLKHVAKVFEVWSFFGWDGEELGVIVSERLRLPTIHLANLALDIYEMAEFPTLSEVKKRTRSKKFIDMHLQLRRGLSSLDRLGIGHTDFHAGNFLVDKNGTYKVIDVS